MASDGFDLRRVVRREVADFVDPLVVFTDLAVGFLSLEFMAMWEWRLSVSQNFTNR